MPSVSQVKTAGTVGKTPEKICQETPKNGWILKKGGMVKVWFKIATEGGKSCCSDAMAEFCSISVIPEIGTIRETS